MVGDLAPGTHRFRLRQVDVDGTTRPCAPITLMLDARYMYGLNSAPSSLGNTSFQGAPFRNQGLTVNAGLAFSL